MCIRDSLCPVCGNYTDGEKCPICADSSRRRDIVCVVRDPRDVNAFELSLIHI